MSSAKLLVPSAVAVAQNASSIIDDDAFSDTLVSTAIHGDDDDRDDSTNNDAVNVLLDRFLYEAALLFATVHQGSYLWNLVESLGAPRGKGTKGDLTQVRDVFIGSYVGNRALVALCSTIRIMLPNVATISMVNASLYAGDSEPSNINGNTTIQAMCSLLCGHPSLKHWDLSKNDIGVAALQSLVALVKGTPSILSIDLRDTFVKESDRWQLDAVLAVNKRKAERVAASSPLNQHGKPTTNSSSTNANHEDGVQRHLSLKLPINGVASLLSTSMLMHASQKMSSSQLLSPKKSVASAAAGAIAASPSQIIVTDDMGSLRHLKSVPGSPHGGPASPGGATTNAGSGAVLKRTPVSIPYLRSKKDPHCLAASTMRYIRNRVPPPTAALASAQTASNLKEGSSSLVPWPRVLSNLDMTKSADGKARANIAQLLTPAWLKGAAAPQTDAQRIMMREVVRRTCVFQAVSQQLFLAPPRPPAENGGIPLSVQAVGGMVGKSLAQADYEAVLYRQRLQQDLILDAVVECMSLVQLTVGEPVWEKGDKARNVYLIPLPAPLKENKSGSPSSARKSRGNGGAASFSSSPDLKSDASIAESAPPPPRQLRFGAVMSSGEVPSSGKSSPSLLSPMMSSTRTQGGGGSMRLAQIPPLPTQSIESRTMPQGQFFGYDEALPLDSTAGPGRVRTTLCTLCLEEGDVPQHLLMQSPLTPNQKTTPPAEATTATATEDVAREGAPQLPSLGSDLNNESVKSVSVWCMRREAFEMFFSEPLFAQRVVSRRIIDAMPCMLGVDAQLRLYLGDLLMNPTVIYERELPLSTSEGNHGRVPPESVDVVPFTQLLDHVILVEEGSMCVRRQGQEMSVFGRGDVIAFDGKRDTATATKGEICEGLRCVLKTGNMPSWKFHVLSLVELRRSLPSELVETIAVQTQKNFKEVDARLDNSGWGRRSKRTPM
ncbi:Hypothetical protein, putative [Bodo saltans]|uniref:Leucine-rich repeat protein n=1 Tax=Bodo saltans TaxID=75058 RepID=A0A0S4JVQ3_BODSA|nr:Hypothetical protein, putative [Bodo saltans]|eukprot:CUG94130.1 Hypothetical protein, putative [Bodo saltans]